jgi:hypothetical protein
VRVSRQIGGPDMQRFLQHVLTDRVRVSRQMRRV